MSQGSKSLALDWLTDLPRVDVDGAAATFDAGSSKDVRVTARNDGFSLHVILDKAPTTAPVYRLRVTTEGVRLAEDVGGQFVAEDPKGTTIFWIKPTVSWDHTQDNLEAGPEKTVPVDAQLVEDADGGQILELRPDFEWLSDPSRIYPVTVDPDTYTSTGARSAYVMSSTPSTGYGMSSLMRTGYENTYGVSRSFVQHVLPARLAGAVTEAKLELYQYDTRTCTDRTIYAYPITQAWTALDQSTPPTYSVWYQTSGVHKMPLANETSTYRGSGQFNHGIDGPGGCPNAADTIDVTKIVKAWDEGELTNHGILLKGYSESNANENYYKAFCTFHVNPDGTSCNTTANVPRLTITYSVAPSVPQNVTAAAGNASATVAWNAPSTDGGSPVTGYTVTASPGGETAYTNATARSATIYGLTNGTAYTFTVKSTNIVGSTSAAPVTATPRTVPGAFTTVTAIAGTAEAAVSWAAPPTGGSPITGYTITPYSGGTAGTPVTAAGDATRQDGHRADQRDRLHLHRDGHQHRR